MKFDRLFCAAIAIVSACCTTARAQGDGSETIHLHMPGQAIHLHPIGHPAPAAAAISSPTATPSAQNTPSVKAARKSIDTRRPAIPFNFGDGDLATSSGSAARTSPSQPVQTAALPPHPETAARASAAQSILTKRGAVLFSKGSPAPSPAQFDGVKLLAGDLAGTLESGGTRVELDGYGGAPGDKSSDARRLSLRRALAVRQLLIDDGVPASRIDVRAMGGVEDKGSSDRVDVFVRAG